MFLFIIFFLDRNSILLNEILNEVESRLIILFLKFSLGQELKIIGPS